MLCYVNSLPRTAVMKIITAFRTSTLNARVLKFGVKESVLDSASENG